VVFPCVCDSTKFFKKETISTLHALPIFPEVFSPRCPLRVRMETSQDCFSPGIFTLAVTWHGWKVKDELNVQGYEQNMTSPGLPGFSRLLSW
jgi:hypothetical protein